MIATLVHTSSRQADARLAMARVAAGPRVKAERLSKEKALKARVAEIEAACEDGQYYSYDFTEVWCFICNRATDHLGEHSPEQIAAWRGES